MQHVLEHVYEPSATMKRVAEILKPGGRVYGELPNFDSWDASLFGRYWGGGHAPRHICFFTPTTLRRLLESCGFERIRITPALHTGHWALSFQNWMRKSKTDCSDLNRGRTWYYPFFLLLTIPINLLQMLLMKTGIMRFEAFKPCH